MTSNARYREVCETLRSEILGGKHPASKAFPSSVALAKRFGTTRFTIRQALDRLIQDGLLKSYRGRGTFVTRLGASRKIGLVVPSIDDSEFFQIIVPGLIRACQAAGYAPVLCEVADAGPRERSRQAIGCVRSLVDEGVAGVIFQPMVALGRYNANAAVARYLSAKRVPLVLLNTDLVDSPKRSDYDVVGIDNVESGFAVGEHLIGRGARRIAFLLWPDVPSVRNRFRGLCLAAQDGRARTRLVVAEPGNRAEIARTLRVFAPDAFVCGNDTAAAVLAQTLARLGRRVPDDILLAGFDDIRHSTIMTPQLTSVRQPCEDIARIAIARLLRRIANPSEIPQAIRLSAPLVVRASTTRSSVKSVKTKSKGRKS